MDLTFFKMPADSASVVHCHPAATRALALAKGKNWLMRPPPRPPSSVGPVPPVPCAEPIIEKLAKNFEPFLPPHKGSIRENHGLVSMTRHPGNLHKRPDPGDNCPDACPGISGRPELEQHHAPA